VRTQRKGGAPVLTIGEFARASVADIVEAAGLAAAPA
jgi:hypothetical protein